MPRPKGPALETARSLSVPLRRTCPQGLRFRGPLHPLPPAPRHTGTQEHTPQTIHPRQPEPFSTLCPKLGGLPPAAHFPLSPAGVWRDRHTPGWTDWLCGPACPPSFFPPGDPGHPNVACPACPLVRRPLCGPGLVSVWEAQRGPGVGAPAQHGLLATRVSRGPLPPSPTLSLRPWAQEARPTWAPPPPPKAWPLEPPQGPGVCWFVFSRPLLFPGKPEIISADCSFVCSSSTLGGRVLSSPAALGPGLGPAGQHLAPARPPHPSGSPPGPGRLLLLGPPGHGLHVAATQRPLGG